MLKKIGKCIFKEYLKHKWNLNSGVELLVQAFYNDYKKYQIYTAYKIHSYGFTVDNWRMLKINKNNYLEYLSDAQYCGLHPLNGHFSMWIDDKLTLKYLFAGSALKNYILKYYFHIDSYGNILPLIDSGINCGKANASDIIFLLKRNGLLAVKLLAGSIGEGFYKIEYKVNCYYINGICVT